MERIYVEAYDDFVYKATDVKLINHKDIYNNIQTSQEIRNMRNEGAIGLD